MTTPFDSVLDKEGGTVVPEAIRSHWALEAPQALRWTLNPTGTVCVEPLKDRKLRDSLPSRMKSQWQVATAAEAFAAAQFSRCGWDVSVQYGANQPEYDLVAVDGDRMLKVSVKGSKDGSWGLTQSHLKNADYYAAIDAWLSKHSKKTLFCLVQFKKVAAFELPRLYLATPSEIAAQLRATCKGRGDTILYEHHAWTSRARGAGTIEAIPPHWAFTDERLEQLAAELAQG
ncbi:MAG: hypothetical protein Q4G70_07475 [Pseudomonadota bacterium]|nr:hypothetical protein [Pseudomonadota bacterium]